LYNIDFYFSLDFFRLTSTTARRCYRRIRLQFCECKPYTHRQQVLPLLHRRSCHAALVSRVSTKRYNKLTTDPRKVLGWMLSDTRCPIRVNSQQVWR